MNSIPSVFRALGVATFLLALSILGAAQAQQAQMAAPAAIPAQSTFCGSQPLCYETADFAATITDFRTSTSGGLKLIDVDVRFQNKTNQPLILGYVNGSGTALDDRGNRYGVWGGNGFRGIGLVNGGNNFDPKFNIRAGSFSDAQFELAWAPGQTAYGLTFELNLTVDEINSIEAGQHTLGGEFPLHYRGLANGVTGASPGQASAFASQGQRAGSSMSGLPPCGTPATTLAGAANSAGGQTAAGANTAVSNASAAIASFGSLFKKKAAAPATSAAASAPCAPAAQQGNAMYAGTSAPPVNAAVPQTTNSAASSATTTAAAAPGAAMKSATTTSTVKPSPAVAKTPAPAVTPAAKKTVVTPAVQKTTAQ